MSRLAKQPIVLPPKVEVKKNGENLLVKGPLGTLTRQIKPLVEVLIDQGQIQVRATANPKTLPVRALTGTYSAHLRNMIAGVTTGFTKKLILEGVGYKAALSGTKLVLNLGFSHQVDFPLPEGIKVTVDKNLITITGADKELVGQTAANLRALKKPEPYKGKGFHYDDEVISRKQGKKVVA